MIWNQTVVRLVPNQSENGKYNLILGWFNKISKKFLCVYVKYGWFKVSNKCMYYTTLRYGYVSWVLLTISYDELRFINDQLSYGYD